MSARPPVTLIAALLLALACATTSTPASPPARGAQTSSTARAPREGRLPRCDPSAAVSRPIQPGDAIPDGGVVVAGPDGRLRTTEIGNCDNGN